MDVFLEELNEKRNELDGDIFEMLYTLSGAQSLTIFNSREYEYLPRTLIAEDIRAPQSLAPI